MQSNNVFAAVNAVAIIATIILTIAIPAVAQETVLYNFDCTASGCEPG